jgi:hypothetical protein
MPIRQLFEKSKDLKADLFQFRQKNQKMISLEHFLFNGQICVAPSNSGA